MNPLLLNWLMLCGLLESSVAKLRGTPDMAMSLLSSDATTAAHAPCSALNITIIPLCWLSQPEPGVIGVKGARGRGGLQASL